MGWLWGSSNDSNKLDPSLQEFLKKEAPAGPKPSLPAAPKEKPVESTPAPAPPETFSGDDALIRANTAEILEDAGYVVVEAGSAEEAMAAIQTVPVDILVTDVNLPGASGPILAERTRALHPLARIIFATGDPSAVGTIDNAAVLAKPYGAGRLLELISMGPAKTRQLEGEA